MSSAADDSSVSRIDRHIGMFEAVLSHGDALPQYLQSYLTAGPEEANADLLENRVHNGFAAYVADAPVPELRTLYDDLTLEDLDRNVEAYAIHPTYVESMLEGAIPVAEHILRDEGYDVTADVDIVYDPTTVGGKFDWETNTIRIGSSPEQLSFSPSVLGILVHELGHVHQFQEKIDAAVDVYNDMVHASPVASPDSVVTEDDELYTAYGLLMMLDPRERFQHLFDLAEEAYEQHPEQQADLDAHLAAAARYEAEQVENAEQVLRLDTYARTHGPLFTWEDEVVPHVLYIQTEGLDKRSDWYTDYVETVIGSYSEPDQLQARIETKLDERYGPETGEGR